MPGTLLRTSSGMLTAAGTPALESHSIGADASAEAGRMLMLMLRLGDEMTTGAARVPLVKFTADAAASAAAVAARASWSTAALMPAAALAELSEPAVADCTSKREERVPATA